MHKFEIVNQVYGAGFAEHATIDPVRFISPQLKRRTTESNATPTDPAALCRYLRNIIVANSSLRVDFGWSFESSMMLTKVVTDSLGLVSPNYHDIISNLISDNRCSWLGFLPYNIFEEAEFGAMSAAELSDYNNRMINFQTDIVRVITSHPLYLKHAILRNEQYRFDMFKKIRKDPLALSAAYQYYLDAITELCVGKISTDILEQEIGMHFLYNPELFFELVDFSILKGTVYVERGI